MLKSGYKFACELGKGMFGTVWKAVKTYAVKTIRCPGKKFGAVEKEYALLCALSKGSSQIPIPEKLVIDEKNSEAHIVMELIEGETLGAIIAKQKEAGCISEQDVINYAEGILLAIKHCHSTNTFVRDLKAENVMVTSEKKIVLIDFGASKQALANENAHSVVGNTQGISPEMMKIEGYDKRVDLWALGMLMYRLCNCEPPFKYDTIADLMQNEMKMTCKPLCNKYSILLRLLIIGLLSSNPEHRPTIKEAMEIFETLRKNADLNRGAQGKLQHVCLKPSPKLVPLQDEENNQQNIERLETYHTQKKNDDRRIQYTDTSSELLQQKNVKQGANKYSFQTKNENRIPLKILPTPNVKTGMAPDFNKNKQLACPVPIEKTHKHILSKPNKSKDKKKWI